MHIPDGYLSPSTCAAMYAASTPFWIVSFRKVARELHTRLVPLISLFSAFSFVVMMFNVPLPGGTSGHAIGLGLAVAVLGPWASIVAISIALAIQALFFGDGGVTALGANCFNMAIAGSLVASLVYRLIARSSPVESRRRVWAGALGGYAGINVAA
ncbi:MAG TPA: energy-coupling factor ABC transporter permease, partial [Bryobacteraceae bacterium]|nr:energy-coupling factor ABC transporter permease [Bryobacteraceae bacterium]